jgi:hypothetical protein
VVYFGKAYGISRALYTPEIPIISIPLTEYNNSDQWLALAHEMGHHFYWNSLSSLEEVERLHVNMYNGIAELLEIQEPWGQWMEEVFAEVCGALLAGPKYLISAQNLAAEKVRRNDDFDKNDCEHPCLALRPWIAYEVLCNLGDQDDNYGDFLEKASNRWQTFCKNTGRLECECSQKVRKTIARLQKEVKDVVKAMLTQPMWPNDQRLLDLVSITSWDIDVEEAEALPPFCDQDQPPCLEPSEDDIPQPIQKIWNFLKVRLPIKATTLQEEKARILWNALVSLSLDDEHGHWPLAPNHTPQAHWWAPRAGRHTHNSVGAMIPW